MTVFLKDVRRTPIAILESPNEEYAVIIDIVSMKSYPVVAISIDNGTWDAPWFSINAWGMMHGFVNWIKATAGVNINDPFIQTELEKYWKQYQIETRKAIRAWDTSLLLWLDSYGIDGYERLADYRTGATAFKGQFMVVEGSTLSMNGMLVSIGDLTDVADWNVNGHGALVLPEATQLAYQKWMGWNGYYSKPFDFS